MKTLSKATIILLAIGVLFLIYLLECNRTPAEEPCPGDGYVCIDIDTWDSVLAIMAMPPDTFIKEVQIKGDPVIVEVEVPVPIAVDPETNLYVDSLVNDSIRFWQEIWTDGTINKWEKRYEPIMFFTEVTIEKLVPQIVEKEIPVYERMIFMSGAAGGNQSAFMFGVDLDYVNKKQNRT